MVVTDVTRQVLIVEPVGALDALAHLGGVHLAPTDVLLASMALAVLTPLAPFDMFSQCLRTAEGILATGGTSTLRSKMTPLISKVVSNENSTNLHMIILIPIITIMTSLVK